MSFIQAKGNNTQQTTNFHKITMAEADLKFDEQIVCTKLAKEYLNSKTEFHSFGEDIEIQKEEKFEIDQFHKTINYAKDPQVYLKRGLWDKEFEISNASSKLLALAQKIEENVQLFCQLEFLLRQIPINDTKDVDLKLVIQSLVYKGSFLDADDLTTNYCSLYLDKDTPLFHLGLVAYNRPTRGLVIVCTKDTVAVCTLFAELCHDVGLTHMALVISKEEDLKRTNFVGPETFREHLSGCVGVVTARCDVDSAVDELLAATTRYSWKLSGVLVQEAALERFTRALEWKTRGASPSPLVLEPAGDARGVPVEAFRSVREALSLIETRAPLAVAAWASDLAEANEIAFGARAPLVWLNGHGHFRGPPAAAAAVYFRTDSYERLLDRDSEILAMLINAMQDQKYTTWPELAPVTRLERICEALEKFHARSPLRIGAVRLAARSTVAVDRGVCVVTRTPVKWAVISKRYIEQYFTRFFNYLLAGGIVNVINPEGDLKLLCELLSETGVPVEIFDTTGLENRFTGYFMLIEMLSYPLYTIKATWTSVGTIFAN